mgnify:CR=1 FL=1
MVLDQVMAPFADVMLGLVMAGIDMLAQWITEGITHLIERMLA